MPEIRENEDKKKHRKEKYWNRSLLKDIYSWLFGLLFCNSWILPNLGPNWALVSSSKSWLQCANPYPPNQMSTKERIIHWWLLSNDRESSNKWIKVDNVLCQFFIAAHPLSFQAQQSENGNQWHLTVSWVSTKSKA